MQYPGRFLGKVNQYPSVSKSNRSHESCGILYKDSFEMLGIFPELLNFDRLFLTLNRFTCNERSVLPDLNTCPGKRSVSAWESSLSKIWISTRNLLGSIKSVVGRQTDIGSTDLIGFLRMCVSSFSVIPLGWSIALVVASPRCFTSIFPGRDVINNALLSFNLIYYPRTPA